jgi:hypothetical protein
VGGQLAHKGTRIRITPDLSIETLQSQRIWSEILKGLREKHSYTWPGILYPAKLFFKNHEK